MTGVQTCALPILSNNFNKIGEYSKRALNCIFPMLKHYSTVNEQILHVNMNQIIVFCIESLKEKMKLEYRSDFEILTSLDQNIKEIQGVPLHLIKAINSLLDNSCYTLHEKLKTIPSFKPTISIKTCSHENCLEIFIRDNGMGISSNHLEKIFTPFFTTKPTGTGAGLGLAAVYDIFVREHHGKIKVDAVEGEYTEFQITMPTLYP